MFVKIPITYKTLMENFTITKRSDGRYCCRIPISYETDANGKKKYNYKTIYGVDENDVRMKQGEYIEQQAQAAARAQHISVIDTQASLQEQKEAALATLLYEESDGDAKFVSEQLRHNDPGFTARTYIHQSQKRKKELLANFQI